VVEVTPEENGMQFCKIPFNFTDIFCENYALVLILLSDMFVTVFMKESQCGVCRCQYPCQIAIRYLTATVTIYDVVPIISWTGVAIWLKTNFGPTVQHHP
jgi:hypothetical protein